MIKFPNAKVNLGLYITQKRNDGFHNIETLFLPVPKLCDILEIIPQTNQSKAVVFTQTGIKVDADIDNNLCVRAYTLLSKHIDLPKVAMHLHKQIPLGAGLGGGSSNGAFALKMLNDMAGKSVDQNILTNIAIELGSDCPFFLTNRPSFASGRGEQLQEVNINLKGMYILLVNPDVHVCTGMAYGLSNPKPAPFNLRQIDQLPIDQWQEIIYNDFEKVIFPLYPDITDLKRTFHQMGATYFSMSGSGSTVFGLLVRSPILTLFPNSILPIYLNYSLMPNLRAYRFLIILALGFAIAGKLFSQNNQYSSIPSQEWIQEHIDSLRAELLMNKTVPSDYECSILAALIFYPDLKSTQIKFKRRALTTTMAARPVASDMFRLRGKRHYKIIINRKQNKRKSPLLKNIPYHARVGVIGHELAHLVDYNNKSFIRIAGNGIAYVTSDLFKQTLEYKIDGITINRGLGQGLYAFRLFVEEEAETTMRYRKFKEKIYMTSSEIAQVIKEFEIEESN